MNIRALLLPLLIASCPTLRAQAPAPAAPPATTEALDPKALDVLKPKVGETVTIEGTIVKTGENKTGTIRYMNFTANWKESASIVCVVSKAPEEFTKEKVDAWLNKKVRATGKLSEYNGQPQIQIEKWDQVVEVK